MNVHIISPILSRFGGGIFTVVRELYSSNSIWANQDIIFFLWGYKDDFCEEDCKSIYANKIFVTLKYLPFNKLFYSAELRDELLIKILDNDIIHLHSLWQYPSILFNRLNKDRKFIKVISPHGMLDTWALNNKKFQKVISLFLYEKRNLNTADCIHALCEQEFKDIRKLAPNVPVAIIPNGVYLPTAEKSIAHTKSDKHILFLGRIHPKKGLENMIKAWANIKEHNWKLVIAGIDENGYEDYLKKIVFQLNLDNVLFSGSVFGKDKEELLLSSDAFILPSFSEGLPMSILEAWSYKLPVLMTPQCNLETGFIVGAAVEIDNSVSGITNGILKLFSLDDENLIDMGRKGYELVKSEYTWEKVGDKMAELYLWLIKKADKPSFVKL
jgi:poly(glycerol-phosphate) alpha-glucosyltransferase